MTRDRHYVAMVSCLEKSPQDAYLQVRSPRRRHRGNINIQVFGLYLFYTKLNLVIFDLDLVILGLDLLIFGSDECTIQRLKLA